MAKPSTPKIQQFTLSEKQRIYQILTESFDFDVAIPMAKLSKALIDAGVDKAVYGYKKAKDFCLDMPEFLTLDDIVMGGVPQIIVTISKVTDWVASVPKSPEPVAGAAPMAQPTQAAETPPASSVPAD
ncbi:MAG: hypothetical protein HGA54_08455, partial [Actinobacteria bacterium]|nr:hypothetical protein [Actinomycetota bacterium]